MDTNLCSALRQSLLGSTAQFFVTPWTMYQLHGLQADLKV